MASLLLPKYLEYRQQLYLFRLIQSKSDYFVHLIALPKQQQKTNKSDYLIELGIEQFLH